jgi:general secretion pathway protein I
MSARRRRERGFTLIEVLVALGVLAATIALVSRTFGDGWYAVRQGGLEARAVAVARAQMDSVGIETPIEAGTRSGVEGDVRWQVQVAPYETPGQPTARPRVPAWWVRVDVTWRHGAFARDRTLTLTTVKLGGRAP